MTERPDVIERLITADNAFRATMSQPVVPLFETVKQLRLRNSLRFACDCIWGNRKDREKDTPEA